MIELNTEQWRVLERAAATVLPGDEQPGAVEADVMGFLRRAFTAGRWSADAELVTSGLRTLDTLARSRYGTPFAHCSPADRDVVLEALRRVPHPGARRFLALLVEMTLTGFLCTPRHGGNRDHVGWATIGWQPIVPARRGA